MITKFPRDLLPGKSGGLNGWTQHSTQAQFAVKTKAKTAG
jgi:hypothetical protein